MMSAWLSARLDAQLSDLSQRWRRCLASLLLFTIILTNNFGVSSWRAAAGSHRVPHPCLTSGGSAAHQPSLQQCLLHGRGRSPTGHNYSASQDTQWPGSCCEIHFYDALNCAGRHSANWSSQDCRAHLDYLQERDRLVEMHYANFADVIDRLDCTDNYSVIYNCSQCKEAYHDWLCAMYIPLCASDGRLLRPCRSHCQRVQRVCPFFLPSERSSAATQYAGEPAFFCDDRDIPDIPPFTTGSTYGEQDCCHDTCCVRPDQPECRPESCSAAAACPRLPQPPDRRASQLHRLSPAARVRARTSLRRRRARPAAAGRSRAHWAPPSRLLMVSALCLLAWSGRHRTRTKGSGASVT